MAVPLHRQPLKGLYIAYTILSLLLLRLPLWCLLYARPSARPRRAWPYTRALTVRLVRLFADTLADTLAWRDTVFAPSYFEREAERYGLVWVDPAPGMVSREIGEWAERNGVEMGRVAGYWYGRRDEEGRVGQRAGTGEKVLYDLHSGGWVAGDASPKGPSAYICTAALAHVPSLARAFSLDYRLARGPPHRPSPSPSSSPDPSPSPDGPSGAFPSALIDGAFPSALLDAAAGYRYLVHTLGFAPRDVVVCGASCGGNLALALVRLLRALASERADGDGDDGDGNDRDTYALPGALLLISPTADWGASAYGAGTGAESSFTQNAASDFVGGVWRGYVHRAWLGALPPHEADTNAWLSPASLHLPAEEVEGMFRGFPPTFVQAGGAEMTRDGGRVLRDRMRRDMGEEGEGERVMYVEVPDGTHMVMAWAWYEPEASECWERFAGWYRSLSSGGGE